MTENNTPGDPNLEQPSAPDRAGHDLPAVFSSDAGQRPSAAVESAAQTVGTDGAAESAAPDAGAGAPGADPGASADPAAASGGAASGAAAPAPGERPAPEQAPSFPAPYGTHPAPQGAPSHPAPTPQPASSGAAFGVPQPAPGSAGQPHAAPGQTIPIDPLFQTTTGSASPKEKRNGGVKVAALIVAAALVGGAAGFGGGALWTGVGAQQRGSDASGPQTVTVNNPGSVNETAAIATKVLPSVVTLEVGSQSGSGSGSGVVLSEDGYVLTNTHVVTLGGAASDPTIRVTTSDGKLYSATIVGTDPVYDLAVIKLDGASGMTPIDFADSSKLNVGSTAVAVGAPLGLSNSVTTGIVSALNRSIQIASSAAPESGDENQGGDGRGDGSDQGGDPFQFDIPGLESQQQPSESISIAVIQTDAAVNPGNSGGALVDSKGSLIGINVAIATPGGSSASGESGSIGLGFAIPSNVAKRVADELMADGKATHGLLGATVQDASSVEKATVAGAYIAEVTPDGAAEKAGLKAGDVVTEFNGVPITGSTDLTAQVRAEAAGADATLSYVRGGKSYDANVTLGTLER